MRKAIMRIVTAVALALALVAPAAAYDDPQQSEEGQQFMRARELLDDGSYNEAFEIFMLVAEADDSPYQDDACYYAAYCAVRLGELEEAVGILDDLLDHFPSSQWRDDAVQLRSEVLSRLGRHGDPAAALGVGTARSAEREAERADREEERAEREAERADREEERAERHARVVSIHQERGEELSEEDAIREAALNALLNMDSERAVPILIRYLQSDPPSVLKERAIFVLSQHETEEAMEGMIQVVRSDDDPEIRRYAIHWLGQFDSEESTDVLIDIYDSLDDAGSREMVIFALGQQGGDMAVEKLTEIAQSDDSAALRAHAIFWLAQVDEFDSIPVLAEIYRANEDREIRQQILFAATQADDAEGAAEFLREVAVSDPDPELQSVAIFHLGQLGEEAIDFLAQIYESTDSGDVKRTIAYALSQIDTEEAVEMMIEFARGETDFEVKRQLIFWLGQTDSERAQEFLLELIEQ